MSSKDHGSAEEDLPEPHDGMTPEEKGELLLRYLRAGRLVAGMDFSRTSLVDRPFGRAFPEPPFIDDEAFAMGLDLCGANLSGINLREANLWDCKLRHADMSNADLGLADLSSSDLRHARLEHSDLRGANLKAAKLDRCSLAASDLRQASLQDAQAEGVNWTGVRVDGADFEGAEIEVQALRDNPQLRVVVIGFHTGLTLTFDTRLHRFDPTAFDAFIAQVLGPETDVTIEERSNIDVEGPSFIRINGSRPEDLVAVAEAFYDRVWATHSEVEDRALRRSMTALEALFGPRLDWMRDHLNGIEKNVGILGDPDVQEMLGDQGAAHVLTKDRKALKTRYQRIAEGFVKEAPKKLLATVIGDSAAGALGEVVGEALSKGLGAAAETAVDEAVEVLMDEDSKP